jgi:hypothetical protein
MSQTTGDDEMSFHRILQMIRISSIIILLLHFYHSAYRLFLGVGFTSDISDNLLSNLETAGLFSSPFITKLIAFLLLALSCLGSRGKKEPTYTPVTGFRVAGVGVLLYFCSGGIFSLDLPDDHAQCLYMMLTAAGYLTAMRAGSYFSRIIWRRETPDPFNRVHESFLQEESLMTNKYSITLPARYLYRQEWRDSHLNFLNPFSGTLLLGLPGCGKTFSVVTPFIKQQIGNGMAMLLYDVKYDDLSKVAYNHFLKNKAKYPAGAECFNICLDDLDRSHRCNCLAPYTLNDITDADEAARTMLYSLNMEWVAKQGDFWVSSAVNFVKALIWFLRRYQGGIYSTWPHVIELASVPYKELFSVLRADPMVEIHIRPYLNAFLAGAHEQLEGQIATATIMLSKLSSPAIYYVMTGNDFTLDLNNPVSPKILTLGGNLQKTGTYGPIISSYVNTVCRLANRKGMYPLAIMLEEFNTILAHTIDKSISTGRANLLAITLCLQHSSQLRLAYGKDYAEVVLNTCANVISGQATGETARFLSDRFGRSMQDRQSFTIAAADTNITQSHQLEPVIPMSRIASLSTGEFVGMVADLADQPIGQKMFCCRVKIDPAAVQAEEDEYKPLPVVKKVTPEMLDQQYRQVKADIKNLIRSEINRIANSPDLQHLII